MTLKPRSLFLLTIAIICSLAGLIAVVIGAVESQHAAVDISWQTASSLDLVEFKVYRAVSTQSARALIASVPVSPGLDPYQTHDFCYRDDTAQPGISYTYLVETVSRDGSSTWSAPLAVQAAAQGAGFFWLAGGLFAAAFASFYQFFHSRIPASGAAA